MPQRFNSTVEKVVEQDPARCSGIGDQVAQNVTNLARYGEVLLATEEDKWHTVIEVLAQDFCSV